MFDLSAFRNAVRAYGGALLSGLAAGLTADVAHGEADLIIDEWARSEFGDDAIVEIVPAICPGSDGHPAHLFGLIVHFESGITISVELDDEPANAVH